MRAMQNFLQLPADSLTSLTTNIMNPSVQSKLEQLVRRVDDINNELMKPDVAQDQNRYRKLTQEYAELSPVAGKYRDYQVAIEEKDNAESMLKDEDKDLRQMADEELSGIKSRLTGLEADLKALLLPKDPNDDKNIFLEIRAGTGGDEAALFAGNLFRMYSYYAEKKHWKTEIVNSHPSEAGGYKEIIVRVIGKGAYSRLKFESGGHRVQRVPETETQGRIHTSACTVAVMPEADDIGDIEIDPSDLRIDTYRASGAGGQHVNRTDSAVRITHLPTGIVVECQDERSQHKNKASALSVLRARILEEERRKQQESEAATRKSLIGSGDRSQRIRTYNFPQGRITDHRINLTLYKLEQTMLGEMDEIIDPLIASDQAEQMAAIEE